MMASRPDCDLDCLNPSEIDELLGAGVGAAALADPHPVQVARGHVAHDNRFESDPDGERWFAFDETEADDIVFWHRTTGRLTTWCGRAFALGQARIGEAATYSFDNSLNIFDSPLEWLRARRDGIVVLDWTRAFDNLRDAPRIAVVEPLLPVYRRHMRPARLPRLFVLQRQGGSR
jgi:hypothetical protein